MEEIGSLVTRARKGDLDAYGQIVSRFQDMAYGYAYAVLGDFHLAEDAAQEAFLEAYRSLSKLNDLAAFAGWFRRIVFRSCRRLLNVKRIHTVSLDSAAPVASRHGEPGRAAEKKEMKDAVLNAIRSLPERERQVTTLFYINGYSQADIAGFLEVPVSTVKNRLHTSRKRLKERMMTMVADELRTHALPTDFPEEVRRLLERPPQFASTESFDLVVLAAARLLGRDPDQETLYAHSANGFAPAIATWENEMGAWHMYGRANGLDLLGKRFGLRIRKLPFPAADSLGETDESGRKRSFQETLSAWTASEDHGKACVRMLREALKRGEVVITEGVLEREPRWWGLVTEVDEDGTVRAASIDGQLDNRVVVLGLTNPAWSVGKEDPSIAAHEADLEMLRLAIQRIRGAGSDPGDVVFGVQAMDMWVAQFAKAPFCQIECGGDGRCAHAIKDSVADGAKAVAAYLGRRTATFPKGGRGLVQRVAERYERIAGLLQTDRYGADLGDSACRRAHADVVRRCKDEVVGAADDMEQILAAEGIETVPAETCLPQNQKALPAVALAAYEVANFEDVREHPERTESALILALLQANAITGVERKTFLAAADTLLAASPDERQSRLRAIPVPLRATAWRPAQAVEARFQIFRPDSPEAAFQLIRASVDAGQAVLADHEQPLAFCGYEDAETAKGRRLFWLTTWPSIVKKWWTWKQFETGWWKAKSRKLLARFAETDQEIAETARDTEAPPGWRVAEGRWTVDDAGRIVGESERNGYLYREEQQTDDLRVTATMRAVRGIEITVWICGSPERTELDGYTLAVSTEKAKLQRLGQDAVTDPAVTIRPGEDHVLSFERRGDKLRGFLDGAAEPFIEWTDPEPLRGEGHRTLGFYVWDGTIAVSDVKVEDLRQ